MPRSTSRRVFLTSLALTAAVSLTGCSIAKHSEGGGQNSDDRFTYVSTSYQPKTITVLDTRDGEELWSVDVPVGKKLVIQFYKNKARNATAENPDLMKWEMGDAKKRKLTLRNAMAVPPTTARRIEMSLRAAPEWPVADASN